MDATNLPKRGGGQGFARVHGGFTRLQTGRLDEASAQIELRDQRIELAVQLRCKRAERFLYERSDVTALEAEPHAQLEWFVTETDRALQMLEVILPEAEALGDAETLSYLHCTISSKRQPVAVPNIPTHVDAILCDSPFLGGVEPKLGDQHLRVLTVLGFPNATTPGLLDALNDLGFAYRWTTRWIALDKTEATKQLTRLRRQWFAKRKSVGAVLREVMFNRETALVDPDADNKALDADDALQELGADDVAFGHLTTAIVVTDADAKQSNRSFWRSSASSMAAASQPFARP